MSSSPPSPSSGEPPADERPRLTEASYIVLGLLELAGQATPYDLKRVAQLSTGRFWSIPHTQLYAECSRLAREGLLDERQEQTGRRRRVYRLTERGTELLDRWRNRPTTELYELRDESTLKLFFGGDPAALAASQLAAHERQLEEFERLLTGLAEAPLGQRLALECGIGHEREFIRFWSAISETDPPATDA
ncbi:MAG TPA: PadR family transcriptional regulator [Solirubrobacteraceae bacterium]|nr:PadR family transcriptional regulator [Solirubrobacteraceae bacterium]